MLAALITAVVAASARTSDIPVAIAFTSPGAARMSSTVLRTTVWAGGRRVATICGPFQVRQWVPVWRAFAMIDGTKVLIWTPGSKPKDVLDVGKIFPATDGWSDQLGVAISPDGRKLACAWLENVAVIDIGTGKVLRHLDRRGLAGVVRHAGGRIDRTAVTWKADGSGFAAALPGWTIPGGSDDSTMPECVWVPLKGSPKLIGSGYPVAFTDSRHILCAEQRWGDLLVRPTLLSFRGGVSRSWRKYGADVGFDSTHVLLAHTGYVDIISPGLTTLVSAVHVADYVDPHMYIERCSLVGLPQHLALSWANLLPRGYLPMRSW